jgi:hypothetical protein
MPAPINQTGILATAELLYETYLVDRRDPNYVRWELASSGERSPAISSAKTLILAYLEAEDRRQVISARSTPEQAASPDGESWPRITARR